MRQLRDAEKKDAQYAAAPVVAADRGEAATAKYDDEAEFDV